MKYLIKQKNYFISDHREEDFAGIDKFITESGYYKLLSDGKLYPMWLYQDAENENMTIKQLADFKNEIDNFNSEDLGPDDGYNCEASSFEVREITEEEAIEFQKIIDDYNRL